MSYLLDTNVLAEPRKPNADTAVLAWLNSVPEEKLFISTLTLGKIHKGISKLPESKKRRVLDVWLRQDLRRRFQRRIVLVSLEVALAWGGLVAVSEQQGRPLPVIDSLLAATAQVYRLTFVTRNVRDTGALPITVLNPWDFDL